MVASSDRQLRSPAEDTHNCQPGVDQQPSLRLATVCTWVCDYSFMLWTLWPLISDETELRVHGNLSLPPDDCLLTLRKFYNRYNQEGTCDMFIKVPAGLNKVAKGSSFSLELFINMERVTGISSHLPCSMLKLLSVLGENLWKLPKRKRGMPSVT